MIAPSVSGHARTGQGVDRPPDATVRPPRLIAFAATLVLAAVTGLPMGSVANLVPQADDQSVPFLGI